MRALIVSRRRLGLLLVVGLLFGAGTQAQQDPVGPPDEEMYSSAVYLSLQQPVDAAVPSAANLGQSVGARVGLNVGLNIRVSDPFDPTPGADLRGRSETTIASDPSGNFLLAGWNDAQGFLFAPFGPPPALGLSGYSYSADGGETWTDGGAPFVFGSPGVVTRGDPWMDTGGPGQKTFFYANLAVLEDGSGGGISVHRGQFSADSFAFDHGVFIPAPNPGDFLDKESLCAGKNGQTKDLVVVATTNFTPGGRVIDAYISKDRAATFPTRTIVQPADGPLHQGTDCAIGKDGSIYVVWELGRGAPFFGQAGVFPEIVIARSDDGGATFTSRMLVSNLSSGALFPPVGYNRTTHNDFPRISVARAGPFDGRLYVVYQDSRLANGGPQPAALGPEDFFGVDIGHYDVDVYLRFSDDKGVTWSEPTLVAGGGDGKIQFWPTVRTDANGRVSVTYNESVETTPGVFLGLGPGSSFVDVFYTDSNDGGATFSAPQRVTEVTTDWQATPTNIIPNFGDYIFHVSTPNHAYVTWADGRSGVMPEVFYATVGVGSGSD